MIVNLAWLINLRNLRIRLPLTSTYTVFTTFKNEQTSEIAFGPQKNKAIKLQADDTAFVIFERRRCGRVRLLRLFVSEGH